MNYYFKVHFKPVDTCMVCAWVRFLCYTVKILGLQGVCGSGIYIKPDV